ncbi:hypothetical protein ACFL6S_27940 [Candidatus Poribacteria bacterium]
MIKMKKTDRLTDLGRIFYVDEEYEDIVDAVITKGRELSHGKRLYFESADFEVQGNAILQRHENLSPDGVPNRLRLDNILMRHRNLNREQAQSYKNSMLKAGFTYPAAISYADTMLRKEGTVSALSWLETMATEMEACDVGKDDYSHSSNQGETIPATYGFHKADDMYIGQEEISWRLKQPSLARRLISTPERCGDLTQLRNLGKGCYEAEKAIAPAKYQTAYNAMTNTQKSVFWDSYNQRKRQLMEKITLSDTAKALIKRIYNNKKSDLPKLKANLVRLQKGQIKVRDPPSAEEWSIIWYRYTQRESMPGR